MKCIVIWKDKADVLSEHSSEPLTEHEAMDKVLRLWENGEVRRDSISVLYVGKIAKGRVENKVFLDEVLNYGTGTKDKDSEGLGSDSKRS